MVSTKTSDDKEINRTETPDDMRKVDITSVVQK